MSLVPRPISRHLSHLDSHYRSRSKKTMRPVYIIWESRGFILVQNKTCFFSVSLHFDSALISWTPAVKLRIATCARSRVCRVI
jgi:hypothetical protein